jgi:methionyl-tRNA synthetase
MDKQLQKNKSFYLTTTLPYVNADPHIGFALEIIQADVLARYKRMAGYDVFFNTGTDEHGLKIHRKAVEVGKTPQEYVDEYAAKFDNLKKALNLSYDNFIRTTDKHHVEAAQEFWKKCAAAGDIYKKDYKVKYCVGCELEKTDSELVDDCCPIHPNLKIEIIEEENYFFRWSKYQNKIIEFYDKNPDFVLPDFRFNEIKNFVKKGLEDFSISRLKNKMPWGVPVPDDDEHVMYVWFDALVNYVAAIGWPNDMVKFNRYWPVVQFAGKDNLRQQSAMWQGMLMSAGVPVSKQIVIHGFVTSNGQKMSKSLGNVVNPYDVVEKYGTDALRYYMTREISPFEDGDFTWDKFKEAYNAGLANGLGNLVSRTMRMAINYNVDYKLPEISEVIAQEQINDKSLFKNIELYEFKKAMDCIWLEIQKLDSIIQETEPFKLIKTDEKRAKEIISDLVVKLWRIAIALQPFMPETSDKIKEAVKSKKMPEPLFMRK